MRAFKAAIVVTTMIVVTTSIGADIDGGPIDPENPDERVYEDLIIGSPWGGGHHARYGRARIYKGVGAAQIPVLSQTLEPLADWGERFIYGEFGHSATWLD